MAKVKTVYRCNICGYESPKWKGRCTCGEWNTLEEVNISPQMQQVLNGNIKTAEAHKLIDVNIKNNDRIITGDSEFDRVLGGGLVKDSVNILSAPPGAGKSTLLLGIANKLALKGINVLYASGEESESQIKSRADRILKNKLSENLYIVSDEYKKLESVIDSINKINPSVVIIDSIQTFTLDKCLPSRAGSPTQVLECANEIVSLAKNPINPKAVIIIGQMVKGDELAGPRQLEHLVDAVFVLEGEKYEAMRLLYATKNRYGSPEVGIYNMEEDGMIPVDNPSEVFITRREEEVVGTAITIIREGSRPLAVEIESLISKSFAPYPSRLGEGIKKDQLNILISILEQRGGLNLWDKNVVVKATGNLKLQEASVSLAIVMSIASSVYKIAIPSDTIIIGELGLTGELKKAQSLEQKIKEANRMGFKRIIVPNQPIKLTGLNIDIIKKKNLLEVIKYMFPVD